ncbi:MAG: response regulator [Pirellulales bacterium]|nr:response regulator [Pirellulales bacterium]
MNVLVADDSRMMRNVIRRCLESLGVGSVLEAEDGAEALRVFSDNSVDMVITDWNMPNKTGLELLREIRERGSKVPVLMVTTEAEKSRIIEAAQAGVSDYLAKPFDNETLRQKLEKFGCGA